MGRPKEFTVLWCVTRWAVVAQGSRRLVGRKQRLEELEPFGKTGGVFGAAVRDAMGSSSSGK